VLAARIRGEGHLGRVAPPCLQTEFFSFDSWLRMSIPDFIIDLAISNMLRAND
jgi:hypothetical protein